MPLQDLIQETQRIYKDMPVGLCYLDTDLRFIHINDWLAEINGIPAEEHLGRTLGELIPDVAAGWRPSTGRSLTRASRLSGEQSRRKPLLSRESKDTSSIATSRSGPMMALSSG